MLDKVESKYFPVLREFVPFTVTIGSPHLTTRGSVILECAIYSDLFFQLRNVAEADRRYVPEGVKRGIHRIIHSTVGYITEASRPQMVELHKALTQLRSSLSPVSVRVRTGKIIATKNKGLCGEPRSIDFQGRRCPRLRNKQILENLKVLSKVTSVFNRDGVLSNMVRDEVVYWIEVARDPEITSIAYHILSELPGWRYNSARTSGKG